MSYKQSISAKEKLVQQYLASNLHLIEPGLQLIDKEYYLRPEGGTRGFIDILAKDIKDNIVVIEVKSARSTTRQALHELFKYEAYLVEKRLLNHEQIRLCIVATDWEELLIPFSNMYAQTQANLEGYICDVLQDGTIIDITRVKPQKLTEGRLFNDAQFLLWLSEGADHKAIIQEIQEHFTRLNFPSYVILTATAPKGFESQEKSILESQLGSNKRLLSRYNSPIRLINVAVQTVERGKLESIVECNEEKLQMTLEEGYDSVQDMPEYYLICRALYFELCRISRSFGATFEYGTCGKIDQRLNVELWNNVEIIRGEPFSDKRLISDDLLVDEITGCFSSNQTRVKFEFSFENRSSISKAKRMLSHYLDNNREWKHPLLKGFEEIYNSGFNYKGVFEYYDPESILYYLYLTSVDNIPKSLIPSVRLTFDYLNEETKEYNTIQYTGIYEKNKLSMGFNEILGKYYDNSPRNLQISTAYNGCRDDNLQIVSDMGFSSSVFKRIIVNPFVFSGANNQLTVDPDFNVLANNEKYNVESECFTPIDYRGDFKDLSYLQFIKEEKVFMVQLQEVLRGAEKGFILY